MQVDGIIVSSLPEAITGSRGTVVIVSVNVVIVVIVSVNVVIVVVVSVNVVVGHTAGPECNFQS